jgi:hypothetical protein
MTIGIKISNTFESEALKMTNACMCWTSEKHRFFPRTVGNENPLHEGVSVLRVLLVLKMAFSESRIKRIKQIAGRRHNFEP